MTMELDRWVGKDESLGVVSQKRPDAAKSRWTFEALAAAEQPHDPAVSPDGTMVAFILDRGDSSDVWVVPVDGGPPTRVTTVRQPHLYWEDTTPAWSPDGTRLAYTNDGKVWVVPVGGGKAEEMATAGSPMWADDHTLVVTVDRDEETRLAILDTGEPWPRPVTAKGQDVVLAELAGGHALYVEYPRDDLKASRVWRVGIYGGVPEQLTGVAGMGDHSPTMSPDGTVLVFSSERDGWWHLHRADIESGETQRLTEEDADFSQARWHPQGDRLVAVRTKRGRADLVTVGFPSGRVEVLAPGGEWSSPRWAGDEVVALHEDHRVPPRLVKVDPEGTIIPLLGQPPVELTVAPRVSPEEVIYTSFDGLEIHGFLFRPHTADQGPVPAVVYPHGGPTAAYNDSWDGHAQYFVDKGYAWFAINYRGSTGYGRDFERANHDVWGVDDTEDCLAAADYLSGLDWIDSRRIAIYGASYGSYLALASMVRDSGDRYACAVLKFGDSDLTSSWAQGDRGGRQDLERMMGPPSGARDAYREGSPLWKVDNVSGPLLIAHGEQDERVHPEQAAILVTELKRLNKPFEYITYPTEAHGFLRPGPQVHFYRRLERFLDWYLI